MTTILSVVIAAVGAIYFLSFPNEQAPWRNFDVSQAPKTENTLNANLKQLNTNIQRIGGEKAAARRAAEQKQDNARLVTYSVAVKGNPSSNPDEFKKMVAETFRNPRGWSQANLTFKEVASGGDFTLILSEAEYLPLFWEGCSTEYSCRVGRNVIINDDRWSAASDSWNAAGGSLRDYRHMVIDHEVGHFLGHIDNEQVCAGAYQPAPLMQQQSMDLRGCTFNPWPLESELWTNF